MRAIEYLKELEQAGKERTRLTEQLQELCYEVAKRIFNAVPVGTEVDVNGTLYRTHYYQSNVGGFGTVVIADPDGCYDFPLLRAIDTASPSSEYYLHNDFGRTVRVASREEFLEFANFLPEIVRAFSADQDKIISALRSTFGRLRKLAE